MNSSKYHGLLFLILLIAAACRISFLLYGDVLPVMWDQRRYVAAGLGIISLIDRSGETPFVTERENRYRFKHYYDTYIQGEQIEWLSYTPHTLDEARQEIFVAGPLYPAILAAVFAASPSDDFGVARAVNVVFDLLTLLLLAAIGRRLLGEGAALVSTTIYALYFPFVLAASMLLLETVASFLFLLAVHLLLRERESHKPRHLWQAGIIAGLLILAKPTASLLWLVLPVAYYFYGRRNRRHGVGVRQLTMFLSPAVVILAGWAVVASDNFGTIALRDPSYSEANLRHASWIPYEGYNLDEVGPEFWTYSIAGQIAASPPAYLGLLAKKLERLWSRPFNDFRRHFLFSYSAIEVIHKLLILLGAIGLVALSFAGGRSSIWLWLGVVYYTGIHLVFHSVSRYAFGALPFVILAAAWLIVTLYGAWRTKPGIRPLIPVAVVLIVIYWLYDYGVVAASLGFALNQTSVVVQFMLVHAVLATAVFFLSGVAVPRPAATFVTVGAVVFLFGVSGWSATLARDAWAEFPAQLDDPLMKAGTHIYAAPELFAGIDSTELLAAVVDVSSGEGRANTFTFAAGAEQFEFVGGRPPLRDRIYPKPTYRHYSELIPLGIEAFPQYAIVPLDPIKAAQEIRERGCLEIWLAVNSRFREAHNFLVLGGRYPSDGDSVYIPSIRDVSIERFVHRGDPRIRIPVRLMSDSSISYYIARDATAEGRSEDLSSIPGRQTGRYNIFLIHFRADGSMLVY